MGPKSVMRNGRMWDRSALIRQRTYSAMGDRRRTLTVELGSMFRPPFGTIWDLTPWTSLIGGLFSKRMCRSGHGYHMELAKTQMHGGGFRRRRLPKKPNQSFPAPVTLSQVTVGVVTVYGECREPQSWRRGWSVSFPAEMPRRADHGFFHWIERVRPRCFRARVL